MSGRNDDEAASSGGSSGADTFSVIILILTLGGVVVNVASIGIMVAKKRNSMFHNLLKILALYDLIVVLGCALLYSLPNLWQAYAYQLYPRLLPWLLPIVQIALMSSVYVTVLMSFERYVRICHLCQLKETTLISQTKFRVYVLLVIVLPVLFYLPRFFEVRNREILVRYQDSVNCSDYALFRAEHPGFPGLAQQFMVHFNSAKYPRECSRIPLEFSPDEPLPVNLILNVTRHYRQIQIFPTVLRRNRIYYQVYCLGLNTAFATVFPLLALLYLNTRTVLELRRMLTGVDTGDGKARKRLRNLSSRIGRRAQVAKAAVNQVFSMSSSTTAMTRRGPEDMQLQMAATNPAHHRNNTNFDVDLTRIEDCRNSRYYPTPHRALQSQCTLCVKSEVLLPRPAPDDDNAAIEMKSLSSFLEEHKSTLNLGCDDDDEDDDEHHLPDWLRSKSEQARADKPIYLRTASVKMLCSSKRNAAHLPRRASCIGCCEEAAAHSEIKLAGGGACRSRSGLNNGAASASNHMLIASACSSSGGDGGGSRVAAPSSRSVDNRVRRTESRLTRISICIVWLFLFCHVWKLIPTVYESVEYAARKGSSSSSNNNRTAIGASSSTAASDSEEASNNDLMAVSIWPEWLSVIKDVSHTLIVFNSAVNFLIYATL